MRIFFSLYVFLLDTFTTSINLFYNNRMIYKTECLEFLCAKRTVQVLLPQLSFISLFIC